MADALLVYRVNQAPIVHTVEKTVPIEFSVLEPREITFNFTAFPTISSSYDSEEVTASFVNSDLSVDGWIYFPHTLGTLVDYSVFMPILGGTQRVVPDSADYRLNSLGINLASYRPLSGQWSILIEI